MDLPTATAKKMRQCRYNVPSISQSKVCGAAWEYYEELTQCVKETPVLLYYKHGCGFLVI